MTAGTSKGGAVQVQFTWLFALFAGAIILLFFITFITSLSNSSEKTLCVDIRTDLDTVFVGAGTSLGTAINISVAELDLTLDCSGYEMPECSSPFGSRMVFAPQHLRGKKLISYALGYDMPYRAANILYLTTPDIRYVFIGGSNEVSQLYDMMPDAVNKELLVDESEAADLENQNNPLVRVVVTGGNSDYYLNLGELNALPKGELSIVAVEPDPTSGLRVTYLAQDDADTQRFLPVSSFLVVGDEAALGAVYSGNGELFNCTFARGLEHYKYVTEVYWQRAINLQATPALSRSCRTRYSAANTQFQNLREAIDNYLNTGDPTTILTHVSRLQDLNEQLKLYSCPTIY